MEETSKAADEPAATRPKWMVWLTRITLVIGIAALIATVWIVGPHVIVEHLRTIGWFFIVIITLEIVTSIFDATAVYYMAYGPGAPKWREAVVAQIVGRGVNSVTPGGNLGEVLKVGLLSQRCPAKRIIAAVMFVQFMIGIVALCFIAVGSVVTAFWFDVPPIGMVALFAGSVLAAGAAVGLYVLLRRGLLTTLSATLARMRIISKKRRDNWNKTLGQVDDRLRGQDVGHRRRAMLFIFMSQALQKTLGFLVVFAAGYTLSPGQFLALASAGVLLGWVSTIIPMGLGILEGGNVALFTLIGAPPSLGLALSLTRRVIQVVFASIGFIVLTTDRMSSQLQGKLKGKLPFKRRTAGAH